MDYASAELKLIKKQSNQSGSTQSNPVLILETAAKISNATLTGEQWGSVILAYSKSLTVHGIVLHANPALMAATITGHHIGNTSQSTPRPLGIQKASIAPGTSPIRTLLEISCGLLTPNRVYRILPSTPGLLEIQRASLAEGTSSLARTLLQISIGSITSHGVYSDIGYGEELNLLKQAVSPTSLPQGQAEFKPAKGTIAHSLLPSNIFTGDEQLLVPYQRNPSSVIPTLPQLLTAIEAGQMLLAGESKLDEKLTISTVGLWSFDEKIILTISGAKQFSEMAFIRSPRSLSIVQTNPQLALLKGNLELGFNPQNPRTTEEQILSRSQRNQSSVLANQQLSVLKGTVQLGFIPLNQRTGEEQILSISKRNQSTVQNQAWLGLLTAQISKQFMGFQRPEKFEELLLGSSPRIVSTDIAYTLPWLQRATVTGLVAGKDLNAVPKELPLLKSPGKDSNIVSPMTLPIVLQRCVRSAAILGGSNYDSRKLLCNRGIWIGSFRLDEKLQIVPCISFDEFLRILAKSALDETIIITATQTIMGFDERVYLWKTSDQPSIFWQAFESSGINFTKGEIVIEHPAITKIEFYDNSGGLIDIATDLTNLKTGKIVTREARNFNIKDNLAYLKVTTADGKIHTVYI